MAQMNTDTKNLSLEERDKIIQENTRTVLLFAEELWANNRVELAPQIFDPGMVRHGGGAHNKVGTADVTGIQGYVDLIKMTRDIMPDFTHIIENYVVGTDMAAVHVTCVGTFTGHYAGVQGKGQKLRYTGFDILKLRNGKICESWGAFDTYQLYKTLGVI
jgi:predicted ester cyclase